MLQGACIHFGSRRSDTGGIELGHNAGRTQLEGAGLHLFQRPKMLFGQGPTGTLAGNQIRYLRLTKGKRDRFHGHFYVLEG